jgi:CheY-like chemotaxis protein
MSPPCPEPTSIPGGKQILIVEDDLSIRETLAEVLEDESYAVLQAVNGQEALNLLNSGARPHLLLLDLMMPVMTGWQFLEVYVRTPDFAQIPVLVFSAASPRADLKGAQEVLHKPLNLEQLLAAVERHIA